MYVNFKLLYDRGFDYEDFCLMLASKQNRTEDLEWLLSDSFKIEKLGALERSGIIEYIKGKKDQSDFSKMRLSKKGSKLLEDFETPEITESDLVLYEWLEGIYKDLGKKIGNRKKTKMFIALFRSHSGIDRNRLAFLCESFIKDQSQMDYSYMLEYVFFKPPSVYSVKFDIEQSRLYKYYLSNKNYFDKKFEGIK